MMSLIDFILKAYGLRTLIIIDDLESKCCMVLLMEIVVNVMVFELFIGVESN